MRPVGARDDRDAPLSAEGPEASFWDHLGATRADEYAQDDILGLAPVPPPRRAAPDPPAQPRPEAGSPRPQAAAGATAMRAAGFTPPPFAPGAAPRRTAPPTSRPGPAPPPLRRHSRRDRLAFRWQRLWLHPLYRALLTRGLPVVLLVAVLGAVLAAPERRSQLADWGAQLYAAVVDRDQFMVRTVTVSQVAEPLERAIRARLAAQLPKSSFRLDLGAMRAGIERFDSVKHAGLRLDGDTLAVTVTEREPALRWLSRDGVALLDADGHRVAILADPGARADLPAIAGEGAADRTAEALALFAAGAALGDRLRGLVRVGARRWDVVLRDGPRIRLPAQGAVRAFERVRALDDAQDLLARDIRVVDLRNPDRPTLRVGPGARETLRAIHQDKTEVTQ